MTDSVAIHTHLAFALESFESTQTTFLQLAKASTFKRAVLLGNSCYACDAVNKRRIERIYNSIKSSGKKHGQINHTAYCMKYGSGYVHWSPCIGNEQIQNSNYKERR